MTRPLWRFRDFEGREHSFWEARAKAGQYAGGNFAIKAAYLGTAVLATGCILKLALDISNGEYDGDIAQQSVASLSNSLPWKVGFLKTTALGVGGIGFGEGYHWLKNNLFTKGQKYNQVAVGASAENTSYRDQRREEREEISRLEQRARASNGRAGDSGAI